MAEQSQDDLRTHLQEQLGFLKADAEAFDRGNRAQAKRLARGVRVLLHDTERSRSLLGLLGLKDRPFVDTATPRPGGDVKTSYAGLVGTSFGASPSEFVPHLHEVGTRSRPFEEWWDATIIADAQQRTISRRDLILNLANKDGGAHIDPKLDEVYAEVSRGKPRRSFDTCSRRSFRQGIS